MALALGAVLRLAEAADEVRQLRVPEQLPDRLRFPEVEPVVVGRAVKLRARRLLRRLALPAAGELRPGEAVEVRIGGGGDRAPPCPRLLARWHGERFAVAELLALGHDDRALRSLEPVGLLLPCQVPDHPRDRIDRAEAPGRLRGRHGPEPADPFAAGESELRHERM